MIDKTDYTPSFAKDSILGQACDLFCFRIDFYSKPGFLDAFMEKWDGFLSECKIERNLFAVDKLNHFQQNMVDIDSVAESLNTTLDNIIDSSTYIFPALLNNTGEELDDGKEMILFVNPYYICFYTRNMRIEEYSESVCRKLFGLAAFFWKHNMVSISDIHVRVGAREVITKEIYNSVDGFGGYRPIIHDGLHNQMATYQFIESSLRCVVSNYMRLVNVIKKDNDSVTCWEHDISAKCILEADREMDADGFDNMFRDLLLKCQDYIEIVCAR